MSLQVVHRIAELRAAVAARRRRGETIGLVPTMGALHAGHGRLIEQARRECGAVVVSIFVNPIQFNQPEDLERYPRTPAADVEFCRTLGVDLVFAPSEAEMYPGPLRTFVNVERLTDHLCGAHRPGHFRGVATVVMKLFMIVQPDRAYFGEKDAQQLAVIRRMVGDLNIPVLIVGVPTVREPDGLALSSRNSRLEAHQRRAAAVLFRGLEAARRAAESGLRDAEAVKRAAEAVFAEEPEVRIEYLEIVDPEEMQPVSAIKAPVRIAVAAWVGETRLIDNLLIAPPQATEGTPET
jgi:pantoate--beta-alanine ligase